jgi:hypothetical protein
MNNEEHYWKLIDSVLERISFDTSSDNFLTQLNELSESEQNLFAAHCCYSEVVNGGFFQFFINSSGILAPESIKGFQAIELSTCSEIIQKAVLFFGSNFSREVEKRCKILDSFIDKNTKEWNPFEKFDEEFYECLEIASNNFLFERNAEAYARKFLESNCNNKCAE